MVGTSKDERVTFIADPSHQDRFLPQVSSAGHAVRRFEPEDLTRVLDFQGFPEVPKDGGLMYGEDAGGDLKFPVYHCCLRGGYVFYFDVEDVDEESGPFVVFHAPPKGVVPLEKVIVEFPPGGRRVFREHAHTDARNGYEMVILHVPDDDDAGEMRPPAFLVADTLGQREKWAKAMRERSGVKKPTLLRSGYVNTQSQKSSLRASGATSKPQLAAIDEAGGGGGDAGAAADAVAAATAATSGTSSTEGGGATTAVESAAAAAAVAGSGGAAAAAVTSSTGSGSGGAASELGGAASELAVAPVSSSLLGTSAALAASIDKGRKSRDKKSGKSAEAKALDAKDEAELASAIVEFGTVTFSEKEWMDNYFATHSDLDVPSKCRLMDHHQAEMKKSLKGAVLEQYEYFVQASGEMTTMGREVASLKNVVETQLETLKEMKEIDFGSSVSNHFLEENDDDDNSEAMMNGESPRLDQPANSTRSEHKSSDYLHEVSDFLSFRRGAGVDGSSSDDIRNGGPGGKQQLTSSSGDAVNESADADTAPPIPIPEWLDDVMVEIAAMAREGTYSEAIALHIKAKNEVADLIDKHERPTSDKLTRKQVNFLKQLRKALDKHGKRISGRLEETLRRKNEALRQSFKRERSDPNAAVTTLISPCALGDDAVYLQLLVRLGYTQMAAEAYSVRRSLLLLEALNERPISGAGSVDLVIYSAQLSQSFFSCLASSVEGFLDLFMTATPSNDKTPEDSDSLADSSLHSHSMKNHAPSGACSSVVLWCDAELAKFASAFGGNRVLANLALCPPPRQNEKKQPRVVGGGPISAEDEALKDRKNSIEVAAQCVDQAFLYATQNLDSVGLPLAPRLAEYVRVRLKGCEDEVAQLLDVRWHHLAVDWRSNNGSSGSNGLSLKQINGGPY